MLDSKKYAPANPTFDVPIFSSAKNVPRLTPVSMMSWHSLHPCWGLMPALLTSSVTLEEK